MESLITVAAAPDTRRLQASAADDSGEAGEVLADFLNYDLQASLGATEGLLALLERARQEQRSLEQIGNAYSLTFDADQATLTDMTTDDGQGAPVALPVAQLKAALDCWAAGIRDIL